eukprot:CFRG4711T1
MTPMPNMQGPPPRGPPPGPPPMMRPPTVRSPFPSRFPPGGQMGGMQSHSHPHSHHQIGLRGDAPGVPGGPPGGPMFRSYPPSNRPNLRMGFPTHGMRPVGASGPRYPWKIYHTPEGEAYYHNEVTNETTWTEPNPVQQTLSSTYNGLAEHPSLTSASTPTPEHAPGQLAVKKVWERYETGGKEYFYNVISKQSVWDKPVDFDTALAPIPTEATTNGPPGVDAGTNESDSKGEERNAESIHIKPHVHAAPQLISQLTPQQTHLPLAVPNPSHLIAGPASGTGLVNGHGNKHVGANEHHVADIPIAEAETIVHGTNTVKKMEQSDHKPSGKPICKVKIDDDTEWQIVILPEGDRFFYNTSTKLSIWDVPDELDLMGYDKEKIDAIVKKGLDNYEAKKKRKREEVREEDVSKKTRVAAGIVERDSNANFAMTEMSWSMQSEDPYANYNELEKEEVYYQLLRDSKIGPYDDFEISSKKLKLDPRWDIVKPREKRNLFNEYVRGVQIKRPSTSEKDNFKALLKQVVKVSESWERFKALRKKDHRYIAIRTDKERKEMFDEYKASLTAGPGGTGDEKDTYVDGQNGLSSTITKSSKSSSTSRRADNFLELLHEKGDVDSFSVYKDVKDRIRKDDRYYAMGSSSGRERLFNELQESIRSKDPKYREHAAIRKREMQMADHKSELKMQMDKERSTYRQGEGQSVFNELLLHVIKQEQTWTNGKKLLRDDPRWNTCGLDASEKERLFREFVRSLDKKAADRYHKLIDEVPGLQLTTPFEVAVKHMEGDPRYERFRDESANEREDEFMRYIRSKRKTALKDFASLLRETKKINYKTKKEIQENPSAIVNIKSILKNDKRYMDLDELEDERSDLLFEHIEEMAKRGSPPPVTASKR